MGRRLCLADFTCILVDYWSEKKEFSWKSIQLIGMGWLAKVLVSVGLKNIFLLPRPMEVFKEFTSQIHLVEGLKIAYWQSFPSGHTMTAFAFASICMFVLKNKYWSILALVLAMAVAYSRVYLFSIFREMYLRGVFLALE